MKRYIKILTTRIPYEWYKILEIISKKEQKPISEIIRDLIDIYIHKELNS